MLCSATPTKARLGETALQCADRYGAPKDDVVSKTRDKTSPLLAGAIHHVYEYQGWRIRAAFLTVDGPAVRMEFSKIFGPGVQHRIQDYELQAIMQANASLYTWKPAAYRNPNSSVNPLSQAIGGALMGQKMWQRTDGALLSHSGIGNTVRLELPAARAYEAKLKEEQERKTRAAVPRF